MFCALRKRLAVSGMVVGLYVNAVSLLPAQPRLPLSDLQEIDHPGMTDKAQIPAQEIQLLTE
ncbi:MAG: hypothetical protein ACRD3W_09980 [Terriglobales bacterium]